MLCVCHRAEFDAVHRQRPPGGGGAAAGGGTAALHGQNMSSSLYAQNPAGAPGSGPTRSQIQLVGLRVTS